LEAVKFRYDFVEKSITDWELLCSDELPASFETSEPGLPACLVGTFYLIILVFVVFLRKFPMRRT
jgi:hypothetical protein